MLFVMVLANNLEQWINKKWDERDARNRAEGIAIGVEEGEKKERVVPMLLLNCALGTSVVSRLSLGTRHSMSLCLAATTVLFMRKRIDPALPRISVLFS